MFCLVYNNPHLKNFWNAFVIAISFLPLNGRVNANMLYMSIIQSKKLAPLLYFLLSACLQDKHLKYFLEKMSILSASAKLFSDGTV